VIGTCRPYSGYVDNGGVTRVLTLCIAILAAPAAARAGQSPASTVSSQQEAAYKLEVAAVAGAPGATGLRVAIRNQSDGSLVRAVEIAHENLFHVFVVGRDLKFFRHLNPAMLPDGSLEVREEIPPGEYLVGAYFLPTGGSPQLVSQVVDLRGNSRGDGPPTGQLATPVSTGNVFDVVTNVRIQPLSNRLTAGQTTAFHVMLSRTEDGRPIVNLEPVLGTGGCLLAVKEDLTEIVHACASTDGLPVSLLTFDLTLPKPGVYAVWVEFARFGETLTARFGVTAR
jgi:hypothetical protein